jgi:hypothetical protein
LGMTSHALNLPLERLSRVTIGMMGQLSTTPGSGPHATELSQNIRSARTAAYR